MKKKRIIIVCSILLALLLAVGFSVYKYWMYRQAGIVLPQPVGHQVTLPQGEETDEAEVASQWFDTLFQGYQQRFMRPKDKVREYEVHSLEVLKETEPLVVQAVFSFTAQDSDIFSEWNCVYTDGIWQGEWVIVFDVAPAGDDEDTASYTASDIMRPAAWDLAEYNRGGQRELDEYQQEHHEDRPAEPGQPYKIENGICYITYDEGRTWLETPLPVEQVDYYVDGQQYTNALQPGSYIITPEVTAILFGGVHTPLSVLVSSDAGAGWQTYEVADAPKGITRKFVSFPDGEHGFIAVGSDKTMNWEMCSLFKTADGGQTWQYIREGPGDHAILSFVFLDAEVGFISYAGGIDISRTTDGGVNWHTVTLEVDEELGPSFTRAETPYWEDDTLVLLVGEDGMSDYSPLQNHYLRYISTDGGASWQFDGIIEKEVFIPG